jgi:hypothetical protein
VSVAADVAAWAAIYEKHTGHRPDLLHIGGLGWFRYERPRPWKHHSQGRFRQRSR